MGGAREQCAIYLLALGPRLVKLGNNLSRIRPRLSKLMMGSIAKLYCRRNGWRNLTCPVTSHWTVGLEHIGILPVSPEQMRLAIGNARLGESTIGISLRVDSYATGVGSIDINWDWI